MALRRADVSDAAVAMVMVVPMHERAGPLPRRLQILEATAGRELGAVLGRAEQALDEGVVVAHPESGQQGRYRVGLERGAVVAVQQ